MRLIDADALNLDYEVEMADDWKTAHEIANVVKYAPTVEAIPKAKLDEIVERLKKVKMRYFLTIANTGDDKLDFAYEKIGNALDDAIEIVKGVINERD